VGIRPNEAEYGAKSTMTAILGRLATYMGKELAWEDAINSDVSLCENLEDIDNLKYSTAPIYPDENGRYKINKPGDNEGVIDWKVKRKKKKKTEPKKAAPETESVKPAGPTGSSEPATGNKSQQEIK